MFLACSAPAVAQSSNQSNISQLINTGNIRAARSAFEATDPSQADRLFFEGRILKSRGQFLEALDSFRRVLQIDPNYMNARRELAHTLLLMRRYRSARYHFQELYRIDQNPQMRDGYRSFLSAIDKNQPVTLSGFLSVLPSTNINRGTANTTFDSSLGKFVIDPESQAESGVGVQVGLAGSFRQVVDPKRRISLNWSVFGTHYESTRYNSVVGRLALSYEQVSLNGRWSVAPYIRKTYRRDEADNAARGFRFDLQRRLSKKNSLSLSLLHERRNYVVQDHQDGPFSRASLSINHQIAASLSIAGGLEIERNSPEAKHLKFNGTKLFTAVSQTWIGGLQTTFGLAVGTRHFDGDFPLTENPRADEFYKISIGLHHSGINVRGFTPRLSCSHTENHSNVSFYDYGATECQATISRNF